jgi:hypothetical protein
MDDGDEPNLLAIPAYPKTVTAAGIIWIVFGCITVLNLVVVVALLAGIVDGRGLVCAIPVLALVALFAGGLSSLGFKASEARPAITWATASAHWCSAFLASAVQCC